MIYRTHYYLSAVIVIKEAPASRDAVEFNLVVVADAHKLGVTEEKEGGCLACWGVA